MSSSAGRDRSRARGRVGRALVSGLYLAALALGCRAGDRAEAGASEESSTPARAEELGPGVGLPGDPLPTGAQAVSLLGDTLFPPGLPEDVQAERESALESALSDLAREPESADALIWVGRRYAYLGEYRKAIEIFSRGIGIHPGDVRFYRHRGHRYITLRLFDLALEDLHHAAELVEGAEDEVEPDGLPNAFGIPTSTLQFNIWYHYGLAWYLKGSFEEASAAYRRCMEVSRHADSKVATAYWWYMALNRSGRSEEAARLLEGLDLRTLGEEVIESGAYLDLLRLYRGDLAPEDLLPRTEEVEPGGISLAGPTLGYGVGNFYFLRGDRSRAFEVWEKVLEARDMWAAFGYVAAEAELSRQPFAPE